MTVFKKPEFEKQIKEPKEETKCKYANLKQEAVTLKNNMDHCQFELDKLTKRLNDLLAREKDILVSGQGTWEELLSTSREIDSLEVNCEHLKEKISYLEHELDILKDSCIFLLKLL